MRDKDEGYRKKAVALQYDADSIAAPKVVAKGSGALAERIVELAKAHNVHVHEDPDLLNVLSVLELQSEIPEHLYVAVAEILAFVYQLNRAFSGEVPLDGDST